MTESSLKTPVSPDGKNIDSSETRTHHPYSPSTLNNVEWCPSYRGAQAAQVHERTTAGTRAHGVADTGEDDRRLSDDDAAHAASCLDFVQQRRLLLQEDADRAKGEAVMKKGVHPLTDLFTVSELKELYLPIDDLKFPDCESTTAGYFDCLLLSYDRKYAEGFDWKFGRWPVEDPKSNLQVISYVLGMFKKFPELEMIRFWIKQPLLDVVKDAVFTRAEVGALYLRVQVVVARAREARTKGDFATANPAVPICQFCAELGRCPKVAEFACKVGAKFHPLAIPADITPSMLHAPDAAALGLNLAAVLKVWCEAFRRQVTDRILRREMDMPPGQKLQTMRKRELVDMAKLRAVALRFLTTAEFESTLEATFGAVEGLISEKSPRGQKESTVKEFQQALLDAGAVKLGDEFSFLRAVPRKD